jgi:hypothetical protein
VTIDWNNKQDKNSNRYINSNGLDFALVSGVQFLLLNDTPLIGVSSGQAAKQNGITLRAYKEGERYWSPL